MLRKKIQSKILVALFVVTTFATVHISAPAQKTSPVAPPKTEVEAVVREAYEKFKNDPGGKNADYIPYLAQVDPKLFGVAIVTNDNQMLSMGDIKYSFSIQSISKVFSQALAMEELGPAKVLDKVGNEPTGRAFNSVFAVAGGIGEFSIHKEFVSAKISGEVASLQDPALDRLIDFATEVGLVVLIHNDVDVPFAKPGAEPAYAAQMKALFKRHPNTTFIWAHIGVGRIIRPVREQAAMVEEIINDPKLGNVHFDISWDEVAKYIVATPESTKNAATIVNRHPDRFLFGTDEVAPPNQQKYLSVYNQYEPFWRLLTPEASDKVRKRNYERIFDEARRKVRSWEAAHVK